MIEARFLSKRFGTKVAVEELSFRAEDGEVTGLLGQNGAGKTTALRILCGLVRPDRGAALVDGLDVSSAPREARRRLGVLPDGDGLSPRLTVREEIAYAGSLHGMKGRALDEAVETTIATLALQGLAGRRGAGLSRGERRKAALGRALVHAPANVLLDEPTTGLDVLAARGVRREIRRLADGGRCVLLSSHAMTEVAALCDRVVVVAKGRVLADGAPDAIVARTGRPSLEEAFVSLIEPFEVCA